jgi:elongator complex protein 1
MSSYQLKTTPSTTAADSLDPSSSSRILSPHKRTPVHVSLSPSGDLLAIIWQRGHVAVWSLNTRIGPGKGKVMDPLVIWTTNLGDGDQLWRQVTISNLNEGEKSVVRVTVLGSGGEDTDQANIHEIRFAAGSEQKPESEESWVVKMPEANGRLVSSYDFLPPFWQAFDGEIFEGWYFSEVFV